jgi:hypothetical protein
VSGLENSIFNFQGLTLIPPISSPLRGAPVLFDMAKGGGRLAAYGMAELQAQHSLRIQGGR